MERRGRSRDALIENSAPSWAKPSARPTSEYHPRGEYRATNWERYCAVRPTVAECGTRRTTTVIERGGGSPPRKVRAARGGRQRANPETAGRVCSRAGPALSFLDQGVRQFRGRAGESARAPRRSARNPPFHVVRSQARRMRPPSSPRFALQAGAGLGGRNSCHISNPHAATKASAAPVSSASRGLSVCHKNPVSKPAGIAEIPTTKWYAP
jgi:hypothetical protein